MQGRCPVVPAICAHRCLLLRRRLRCERRRRATKPSMEGGICLGTGCTGRRGSEGFVGVAGVGAPKGLGRFEVTGWPSAAGYCCARGVSGRAGSPFGCLCQCRLGTARREVQVDSPGGQAVAGQPGFWRKPLRCWWVVSHRLAGFWSAYSAPRVLGALSGRVASSGRVW